jgi:hypothetical protein
MHVLIIALSFAAFIINAVKTDTAGGRKSALFLTAKSFGSAAAFGGDEEIISIYHFLS